MGKLLVLAVLSGLALSGAGAAYAQTPTHSFTLGESGDDGIGAYYFDASFDGLDTPVATAFGNYTCIGWESRCTGENANPDYNTPPLLTFPMQRQAFVDFEKISQVLGPGDIGPQNSVAVSGNVATLPAPPEDFGGMTDVILDFKVSGAQFTDGFDEAKSYYELRYDLGDLNLGEDTLVNFYVMYSDGSIGPDSVSYHTTGLLDAPLRERSGTVAIPYGNILALDRYIGDDDNVGVIISFVNEQGDDYSVEPLADSGMDITFDILTQKCGV